MPGFLLLARRSLAVVATALLITGGAGVVLHRGHEGPDPSEPVFGVLQADSHWLSADSAAGIRLAMINVYWNRWEPQPGRMDGRYAEQVADTVARYRSAGWQVAIDVGLQTPPPWVLALPSGNLLDQNHQVSTAPDYEFSNEVRRVAAVYIAAVVRRLGPVQYYRVGLSDRGEAKYPDVNADGWWAFDPTAQGSASGLPPGVHVTPLPGWVPGTPTYRGQPVTASQVEAWYRWYFGAMVNAHAWEISSYRSAGYHGSLELVVPGTGAMPSTYATRMTDALAPAPAIDYFRTVNTGAVWWKLLDELPDLQGVVVDVSSVYDDSGTPRGNGCQATDQRIHGLTNGQFDTWSDTRWLTYLAHLHNLAVMGENPGDNRATDLPAIMALVRSCHLLALQWAFETQLHGGPNADIEAYGSAITRFRAQQPL